MQFSKIETSLHTADLLAKFTPFLKSHVCCGAKSLVLNTLAVRTAEHFKNLLYLADSIDSRITANMEVHRGSALQE